MEDSDVAFERVLHSIGEDGRFHTRYNIVFNFLVALTGTMVYVNFIMAVSIPNHWCHVPGRNDTNYTLDEWKHLTLPRITNSFNEEVYSNCFMYNASYDQIIHNTSNKEEISECQNGYEFDQSWYKTTIVSDNGWVCENEMYVYNLLAINKLAEVVGGVFVGYLGDIAGRRPVFFFALVFMVASRAAVLLVGNSYIGFVAAVVVGSLPSTSIGQSCMVTIMELSPPEDRATIAQIQYLGWSIGLCMLPLINWLVPFWDIYIMATTAPLTLYFFIGIFLVESPKWLLSRGRIPEALNQLKYIAKVNKTRLSVEASLLLQNSRVNVEKVYGVFSLFSNWRMTKNTIFLACMWMTVMLSYYTLFLMVISTPGNPFLFLFLQCLAEVPAYISGRILCDRIGRRFCCMSGLLIAFMGYTVVILTMGGEGNEMLHLTMITMSKFAMCISFYVANIQGLEMYPTCVRQSANSFGITTGNMISVFGSYIIYLGDALDARMPCTVLAILSVVGFISQIFLPETLHQRLPETLHDAKIFGKDQDYWSFPHRQTDPCVLANLKFVHRQPSESIRQDDQ